MATRPPVLFFGHGTPMLTLTRNKYTSAWAALGKSIPKPKEILCISAHWMTQGFQLTAMATPRTIHDFGGFPRELYSLRYPAPGAPDVAREVVAVLREAGIEAKTNATQGFDHGAWVPISCTRRADRRQTTPRGARSATSASARCSCGSRSGRE